ncbi:MAG: SDR family NAD(P)-dependent oxidoreductase [Acidimicrobiales bacterium]
MKGRRRVVVVTGGAAGIGAAIAEEFGRNGDFVVTLDPVVSLDGSSRIAAEGPSTAERIVEAGGTARASHTSVTDRVGVQNLFATLVEEFGSLDAVVNVAGISRPTDFASGTEEDWAAVLSVHLDGYLNVLGAALPIMVEAGHGRILGVTSGSGWRPANTGAYGCAKRAVAALTWQIGRATPAGVTVNALSPVAATRMVTGALSRPAGGRSASDARTGGLSLGSVPPPENLGPVGVYLASEEFSWCRGQVIFSSGSEAAWITPPRLLEVCRSADVRSLPHALDAILPIAFSPAEQAQVTNGGSNPRFGPIFDEPAPGSGGGPSRGGSCVVVTDDPAWAASIGDALTSQGIRCLGVGMGLEAPLVSTEIAQGFAAAAQQLSSAARDAGTIDAVVVALVGDRGAARAEAPDADWREVLEAHAGITQKIRTDAGWARAVADYSAQADRPVRLVMVTEAISAGGRSRAQAAAQLARSSRTATSDRVESFAISAEGAGGTEHRTVADLAAYCARSPGAAALSGAELVASSGWFGLRSHPSPAASISFGGPEIPEWFDGALRRVVTGSTS